MKSITCFKPLSYKVEKTEFKFKSAFSRNSQQVGNYCLDKGRILETVLQEWSVSPRKNKQTKLARIKSEFPIPSVCTHFFLPVWKTE